MPFCPCRALGWTVKNEHCFQVKVLLLEKCWWGKWCHLIYRGTEGQFLIKAADCLASTAGSGGGRHQNPSRFPIIRLLQCCMMSVPHFLYYTLPFTVKTWKQCSILKRNEILCQETEFGNLKLNFSILDRYPLNWKWVSSCQNVHSFDEF